MLKKDFYQKIQKFASFAFKITKIFWSTRQKESSKKKREKAIVSEGANFENRSCDILIQKNC